jgi:hypothetical protein
MDESYIHSVLVGEIDISDFSDLDDECDSNSGSNRSNGESDNATCISADTAEINEESSSSEEDEAENENASRYMDEWNFITPPENEYCTTFTARNCGMQNGPSRNAAPINYFFLFFTSAMWQHIVTQTNIYARKIIQLNHAKIETNKYCRLKKWVDVSTLQVKKYVALLLNMGLTVRKNTASYWDQRPSQVIPFYNSTMSLKKFELISRMIHVNASEPKPRGDPEYDPWHKIRPYLDMLNASFKIYFKPNQSICVDESMIGMKNRFVYIQYMPNKRHSRFGIKKFQLCDSNTSYVVHVDLYAGKDFPIEGYESVGQQAVIELLRKCQLFGKGYHLYTDNFYTKLPLAKELLQKQVYLTGTIRKNSRDIPKTLIDSKLTEKQTIYMRKNEYLLVGYKEKKQENLSISYQQATTQKTK